MKNFMANQPGTAGNVVRSTREKPPRTPATPRNQERANYVAPEETARTPRDTGGGKGKGKDTPGGKGARHGPRPSPGPPVQDDDGGDVTSAVLVCLRTKPDDPSSGLGSNL